MRATPEDWDAWYLADWHIGDTDELGVIAKRLYAHFSAKSWR